MPGRSELEDPKDLRAEIGKYSNSTNERKQMSNKTKLKRISLILTTTLSAGLLTLVSTPTANAAAEVFTAGVTAGRVNTLYIATTKSITGSAGALSPAAAGTFLDDSTQRSVGWLADSSASAQTSTGAVFASYGYVTASTADVRTGVVAPGASLSFTAVGSSTTADGMSVVVTGGTLASLTATAGTTVTLGTTNINSTYTTVTVDSAGTDVIFGLFNVTAATGSVATISVYSGSGIDGTTALATAGTLVAQYQLTVGTSSASGAYSAAESTVTQGACISGSTTAGSSTYDVTNPCASGTRGTIWVDIEDAYGAAVSTGTITAQATNGSLVFGNGTNASVTGDAAAGATLAFSTVATDDSVWFAITQPVANTAGSTVVTVTFNGAVIATKTINWHGALATLTVDTVNSASILSTNQADVTANVGAAGVIYVGKDAAGNVIALSSQPTVAAATGALVGATTSSTTVDTHAAVQTVARGYGYTTLIVPDNDINGGKATYQLQMTSATTATIKSNVVNVTVSRAASNVPTSFTASWDKATYVPGDIATLTISGKDAFGNLMADGTTLGGLSIITNTTGFASVGSACSTSSKYAAGVKTCKFSVGNTEGAYSWSVALTTTTSQSAIVGTAKVAPATAAVSNADVLKSIVALIASINKQIQALQKLILKR